jgi:hypothetical protein
MQPMNYFAHTLAFLDRPYFVAGACVPDWLTVADRRVRVRSKHAEPFCDDSDPDMAAIAAGVLQHLHDDARFHATRAFAETTLALSVQVRDVLDDATGLRPSFLGHLLVELLLDAALIADDPSRLTKYYAVLDTIHSHRVESLVNRMAPRPSERLAVFIDLFRNARVLWDYLEDDKLWVRLNQIMRRVQLPLLPDAFITILPAARQLVAERKNALLEI